MADRVVVSSSPSQHSSTIRGLAHAPASRSFSGRFGRLFRELPAAEFSDEALVKLAEAMVREREPFDVPLGESDEEDNSRIPSGYTYLGQFIDHDVTFDPVSTLDRQNDPDALVDYRTPRLDLDSLYGRGPSDQPYMYSGARLVSGKDVSGEAKFAGPDLPRATNSRAIIGDPRNDENKIISQLHSLMIRFHNKVAHSVSSFEEAQHLVRWHYQWIVLHDFLPRVCGQRMVSAVLGEVENLAKGAAGAALGGRAVPHLDLYRVKNEAFIPVEFSVAAYRFGHSMVRPSYLINDVARPPPGFHRIPLFSPHGPTTNLNGFDALPDDWGVQWGYFFELRETQGFPQPSYQIDERIASPLGCLPPAVAANPSSLPLRNLKRGVQLGLPSGQDVARYMGLDVLTDQDLFESRELRDCFAGSAPLWYYILRESRLHAQGSHLGPVGARIVAEVLIGLLWHDSQSFLRRDPRWRPTLSPKPDSAEFGMTDLVKYAEAPI